MLRLLGILAFFGSDLALAQTTAADPNSELKRFEGTWKVVHVEKEGKPLPVDRSASIRVINKGSHITIKDDRGEETALLKLDSTTSPASIDFIPTDDVKSAALGIYAFEGETLKLCWSPVGKERPKTFASRAETETRLLVLVRVP